MRKSKEGKPLGNSKQGPYFIVGEGGAAVFGRAAVTDGTGVVPANSGLQSKISIIGGLIKCKKCLGNIVSGLLAGSSFWYEISPNPFKTINFEIL